MKTNWTAINDGRVRSGYFASNDTDGWNGTFLFTIDRYRVKVIASDGLGWRHVSVSLHGSRKYPPWRVMDAVVKIFWGNDEYVMQLHVPADKNINNHSGCLHCWQPTDQAI